MIDRDSLDENNVMSVCNTYVTIPSKTQCFQRLELLQAYRNYPRDNLGFALRTIFKQSKQKPLWIYPRWFFSGTFNFFGG